MENRIIHSRLTLHYITNEITLSDTNAIFHFLTHMVSFYSTFLFCLLLWPGQETTTRYFSKQVTLFWSENIKTTDSDKRDYLQKEQIAN